MLLVSIKLTILLVSQWRQAPLKKYAHLEGWSVCFTPKTHLRFGGQTAKDESNGAACDPGPPVPPRRAANIAPISRQFCDPRA
jgi:hypothetical protein